MVLEKFLHTGSGVVCSTMAMLAALVLSGCYSQVSSMSSFNGEKQKYTNQCQVVRTSLYQKFDKIVSDNQNIIQGDSHVETDGSYMNVEAAYDCMVAGAKSILVLERGVIATSTAHVGGRTTTYYNYQTNQAYTRTSPGYNINFQTSGYIVVFFKEELPESGTMVTWDDYKTWHRKHHILMCDGCE